MISESNIVKYEGNSDTRQAVATSDENVAYRVSLWGRQVITVLDIDRLESYVYPIASSIERLMHLFSTGAVVRQSVRPPLRHLISLHDPHTVYIYIHTLYLLT